MVAYVLSKKSSFNDKVILLVRLDAIGDYIIGHEIIREIKNNNPDSAILLLCDSRIGNLPEIDFQKDKIIQINSTRFINEFRYSFNAIKRLLRYSYLTIINPCYSRTKLSDNIVSILPSKNKIGWNGDATNISINKLKRNNRKYTFLLDGEPVRNQHEIVKNNYFVKKLTGHEPTHRVPVISDVQSELHLSESYFVFALGASYDPRAWSVANFAKLSESVPEKYKIVLLGYGMVDERLAEDFINMINRPDQVINLVGKTTVIDSVSIIENAKLIIGNDSAVVHIAVATKTPSICIAPGAHLSRFAKYPAMEGTEIHSTVYENAGCVNCNYNCLYPMVEKKLWCISSISIEKVKMELNNIIFHINA